MPKNKTGPGGVLPGPARALAAACAAGEGQRLFEEPPLLLPPEDEPPLLLPPPDDEPDLLPPLPDDEPDLLPPLPDEDLLPDEPPELPDFELSAMSLFLRGYPGPMPGRAINSRRRNRLHDITQDKIKIRGG